MQSSEEEFTEYMDRLVARTSTITVVVCHRFLRRFDFENVLKNELRTI